MLCKAQKFKIWRKPFRGLKRLLCEESVWILSSELCITVRKYINENTDGPLRPMRNL